MSPRFRPAPRVVAIYGALGLIPFWAPSVIAWSRPDLAAPMRAALAEYAALILSFLGGARWAFDVARPPPSGIVVTLAMLPTLVGLGLLLAPEPARLAGLAVALGVIGLWDMTPGDPPEWYPSLRGLLTLGAVGGLLVGSYVFAGLRG